MIAYLAVSFLVSLLFTSVVLWAIIPRLKKMGMVGHDVNKPDRPEVAEMGGIGVVAGMALGILVSIFFNTFLGFQFNLDFVLASLVCVFIIAFIGFVDDLLDIPQAVKAFLPLLAGIPLIALRAAGSTTMYIPFLGSVDFGMVYLFVAIPIGIAVASNLTNMLAGFNGLEAGMGAIALCAAAIAALLLGSTDALVIYIPLIGALLGFLVFNRFPARIFPGDVATLMIGATLAVGSIVGNFEALAALLLIPYVVDFFIKAANRFPSSKWWGEFKGGKLYPVEGRVRGFAQLVMKLANGISESNLVLFFVLLEALVSALVLLAFFKVKVL